MLQRLVLALVCGVSVCGVFLTSAATAQVVRFETSVGDFDMVLNPTNNPLLQDYVDNFLGYVDAERYHCAVINRAAEGFVMQTGGFKVRTPDVPSTVNGFMPITTFNPVEGVPAAEIAGLSNTIGTVALALPGDGMGGTDEDAGTSSFFVNLTDNSFLDADFTVFAEIPDLTTINTIMGLNQVDLTQDPNFGAGPGNLAFTDVPLLDNGNLVLINRAFVIEDTLAAAAARAGLQSNQTSSQQLITTPVSSGLAASAPLQSEEPSTLLAATAIPEPAGLALVLVGICFAAVRLRIRKTVLLR